MREDDEEIGSYLPLLRRIIVLVAVITAVPVILWSITAFVRAYVGPAKVPTFHQLAATASINAPANTEKPQATADRPAQAAEAPTAAAETVAPAGQRDASAAPKVDRAAEIESTGAIPSADKMPPPEKTAMASATLPAAPRTADASLPPAALTSPAMQPSGVLPPSSQQAAFVPPGSAPQQIATLPSATDALPAGAPLAGPIPLPKNRPRTANAAVSNAPLPRHRPPDAEPVHVAETAPSAAATAAPAPGAPAQAVPTPRPRPDGSAGADDGGPLGFLHNLFGGK